MLLVSLSQQSASFSLDEEIMEKKSLIFVISKSNLPCDSTIWKKVEKLDIHSASSKTNLTRLNQFHQLRNLTMKIQRNSLLDMVIFSYLCRSLEKGSLLVNGDLLDLRE